MSYTSNGLHDLSDALNKMAEDNRLLRNANVEMSQKLAEAIHDRDTALLDLREARRKERAMNRRVNELLYPSNYV